MNNWLVVFSIVLVSFLLIGLNFKSLTNYAEWIIPLNGISPSSIHYTDQHVSSPNYTLTPTVSSMEYIDENTIELTFNKNGFFMGKYEIPNEFEFVTKVKVGDIFIAMCHDSNADKLFHIDIFHFVEMNNTHTIFNHYYADLPTQVECKYPDIIRHSLDVSWKNFPKKNKTII